MMENLEAEPVTVHVEESAWVEEAPGGSISPKDVSFQVLGYTEDGSIAVMIDVERWVVPDDQANGLRQAIGEWEAQGNTIPAYLAKPSESQPYRLYKSIFIGRLSDDEAATMEAVLAGSDAKLRLVFNSVEYFVSDDPLFETLYAAVSGVLGEARAAALLGAAD